MTQTIRDLIKRRVRWCMAIGIGGWLLIALSAVLHADNLLIILAGVAVFGGAVTAVQLIRCPRRSARPGHDMAVGVARPVCKPVPITVRTAACAWSNRGCGRCPLTDGPARAAAFGRQRGPRQRRCRLRTRRMALGGSA
jgi:hypothetical protein